VVNGGEELCKEVAGVENGGEELCEEVAGVVNGGMVKVGTGEGEGRRGCDEVGV
jgi:hypothetical protein